MISTLKADVLIAAGAAMAAVLAVRGLASKTAADADASLVTLILICTAIAMVKLTGVSLPRRSRSQLSYEDCPGRGAAPHSLPALSRRPALYRRSRAAGS